MIVKGKERADKILHQLKTEITEKSLTPQLAIILAGNEPASRIYIKYKQKAADTIGIKVVTYEFAQSVKNECIETVKNLNTDPLTNGIIVQLPVYTEWSTEEIVNLVNVKKDVDGFLPDSQYIPATADAVWEMLGEFATIENFDSTESFLKNKTITILGKGKTAGKPTRDLLNTKGFTSTLIDSKTVNPNELIKNADIVISATGKKNIINGSNIKTGAYIIGIGVGKELLEGEEKIYGDINIEEIRDKAKLICPTIGGIGPLTIACLLRNVVQSAMTHN